MGIIGRRISIGLVAAGLLAAAALAPPASASAPSTTPAATAPDRLTVTVTWAPGLTATWTLRCDPPRGTHPNARRACARLATIPDPFSELPPDVACTMVYAGPETARVTGRWQGRPVNSDFSRNDGCQIARWQQYRPLLTDPSKVVVRGRVDLGPTCPVQRPDASCEIVGAESTVSATSGTRLRVVASGPDGFALRLARRVWSITSDAGMRCPTVVVDLRAGREPDLVLLSCDTGIR